MQRVAEAVLEDVSERFPDLQPGERMFRTASGYMVKVTTQRVEGEVATHLHFRLVGALCRDDGQVQVRNGVSLVGAAHALTVQPETQVDVAASLAAARALVAGRMELAAIHHAQADSLTGVA